MTTQRTIDDLTPEERERIVAGLKEMPHIGMSLTTAMEWYLGVASALLNISEDTVRQVLREEGNDEGRN